MATTDSIAAPSRADTPAFPSPTPCRPWCSHDGRFPTVHESAPVSLPSPLGLDSECGDLMSAWIAVDDDCTVPPEVTVAHDGFGVSMSAAEAVEFASRLMAFASQIHTLARAALASPTAA